MITEYEHQYMSALTKIYNEGFADGTNERTGVATKRLPGIIIQVDVEKEFPILKSKKVAGKTALREILWIWQQQSNNIHDLKAHIWDEWADKNGSINKAYGFQMNRPICIFTDTVHRSPESFRAYANQATYILEYLREFPNGRCGVATIWNPEELSGMNLVPCCHTTTWNLDGGRLNCVLDQRSGDMPYGVPFNTTQYAELMILFARDLGVKPGILTHVIADAHIYDRQMSGVELQIQYYKLLKAIENGESEHTISELVKEAASTYEKTRPTLSDPKFSADILEDAQNAIDCIPCFDVGDNPTGFFNVDGDKCMVRNYNDMGTIDFGDVVV